MSQRPRGPRPQPRATYGKTNRKQTYRTETISLWEDAQEEEAKAQEVTKLTEIQDAIMKTSLEDKVCSSKEDLEVADMFAELKVWEENMNEVDQENEPEKKTSNKMAKKPKKKGVAKATSDRKPLTDLSPWTPSRNRADWVNKSFSTAEKERQFEIQDFVVSIKKVGTEIKIAADELEILAQEESSFKLMLATNKAASKEMQGKFFALQETLAVSATTHFKNFHEFPLKTAEEDSKADSKVADVDDKIAEADDEVAEEDIKVAEASVQITDADAEIAKADDKLQDFLNGFSQHFGKPTKSFGEPVYLGNSSNEVSTTSTDDYLVHAFNELDFKKPDSSDTLTDTSASIEDLLRYCETKDFLDFSKYIECLQDNGNTLIKIGEASYSEVFGYKQWNEEAMTVMKVIPFGGKDQSQMRDILQEVAITKELSATKGFVSLTGVTMVKGQFPTFLLDLWDRFDQEKGSESHRPDFYNESQLYCVISLEHGGCDLEKVQLVSWTQKLKIFEQTVQALAEAERKFKFEHRDLHNGNLLVKLLDDNSVATTIIDYTLSRAELGGSSSKVTFKDLNEDEMLFEGEGDYQFDIYRNMSDYAATQQQLDYPDWSRFMPHTNVLWLHYLTDVLLRPGTNGLKIPATRGRNAAPVKESQAYEFLTTIEAAINPTAKTGKKVSKKASKEKPWTPVTAGDVADWLTSQTL